MDNQDMRYYYLFVLDYIIVSIVWLENLNILIKVSASLLSAILITYTIMKVRQDIRNKKQQERILKLQAQQEEQKLFQLMEENKEKFKNAG